MLFEGPFVSLFILYPHCIPFPSLHHVTHLPFTFPPSSSSSFPSPNSYLPLTSECFPNNSFCTLYSYSYSPSSFSPSPSFHRVLSSFHLIQHSSSLSISFPFLITFSPYASPPPPPIPFQDPFLLPLSSFLPIPPSLRPLLLSACLISASFSVLISYAPGVQIKDCRK